MCSSIVDNHVTLQSYSAVSDEGVSRQLVTCLINAGKKYGSPSNS